MRLDLDGLADASREALMSEWREVVGRPPPKHLSRPLMVQILSHAYQVDTVGGYTKRLDRRLKSAAQRDVVRPAFKPGSRFMREYHGITHVVDLGDDGRFVWNERSFKSLSHTARTNTTRQSSFGWTTKSESVSSPFPIDPTFTQQVLYICKGAVRQTSPSIST